MCSSFKTDLATFVTSISVPNWSRKQNFIKCNGARGAGSLTKFIRIRRSSRCWWKCLVDPSWNCPWALRSPLLSPCHVATSVAMFFPSPQTNFRLHHWVQHRQVQKRLQVSTPVELYLVKTALHGVLKYHWSLAGCGESGAANSDHTDPAGGHVRAFACSGRAADLAVLIRGPHSRPQNSAGPAGPSPSSPLPSAAEPNNIPIEVAYG